MNSIEKFLDRLPKYRRVGEGRYTAKCPAHDDSSSSLSVTYNGSKVLINCFAGCSVLDVLNSVGLELQDLFDENRHDFVPSTASRAERIKAETQEWKIERAIMFLQVVSGWIADGKTLTPEQARKANAAKRYLQERDMLGAAE